MNPIRSLLSSRVGQGTQIIGTPMTVFPIFWNQRPKVETVLAASAITSGTFLVGELARGASVPTLSVSNSGSLPVLIPQGTLLTGGRQDRVVNQSVLIGAGRQSQISVSCVQHGRWHVEGQESFRVGESVVSTSTRFAAGSTVFGDLAAQRTVWNTVAQLHTSLGVHSESQQFTAVFNTRGEDIRRIERKLPYVDGAYGLAIALGRKVVSIDVFADAETCRQMWSQIVRGSATEALGARYLEGMPRIRDVAFKLRVMTDNDWQSASGQAHAVSWHRRFGRNQCSLLGMEQDLLHLSMVRQTAV